MGCNCGCGGKSQTKKWDLEPKFSDLKKGDKAMRAMPATSPSFCRWDLSVV